MIYELQNILWVKHEQFGEMRVLFLIDYGPEANSQFMCIVKTTGEFKCFDTNQVKATSNYTLGENVSVG